MIDLTPKFERLHAVYCEVSQRVMPMSMQMMFAWEMWDSKGWNESDLRLVAAHIKDLIRQKRRRPESFRFHNLIGDTERFLEDVSEARALARMPKPTERDKILAATGRTEPVVDRVRTPAQILEGEQALKKLLELRESL